MNHHRRMPPPPRSRYRVTIKVWNGQRYDHTPHEVTATSEASARLKALNAHALQFNTEVTTANIEHVTLIGRASR